MSRRLPTAYFDDLYRASDDPWQMATSAYEAAKYAATVAMLPRPHYSNTLEIGCAIGVLSGVLADRCGNLVAVDVAEAALGRARDRNRSRSNIRFVQAGFPDDAIPDAPAAGFDLIMLSEVLYYFAAETLPDVVAATRHYAAPGADVALVHWLGPTPDYPLTGDAAAEAFLAALPATVQRLAHARTEKYRIDVLRY